jgi:APA family basic amino acid/polyamine antiporter
VSRDVGSSRPGIFAIRPVESLLQETHESGHELKRAVSATQLTALGVGAIIGTGIFVVVGVGADIAGPAVIVSFVVAAVACAFSALSYAELASSIPVSGSAYTYAYATMGELVAWIIGWDLLLEYGLAAAAVAVGWSGSLNSFLDIVFGVELPAALAAPPGDGGTFNLPAVLIILGITLLLIRGARESAMFNLVMVVIKLAVLAFFIVVALSQFSSEHFTPFAPHGFDGIISGAAIIFFAYLGFDAVATGGEESRNPRRDLPLAIIASLAITTVFYMLVAVGALGIASPAQLAESEAPLVDALEEGAGISWAASVLALGAVIALTSVLLVVLFAQSRILFAMCRDGLLPEGLAAVNRKFGTPTRITLVLGGLIALLAGLVPLQEIVELVNIGTLFAFVLVNIGVIVLRRTRPDMQRGYKVPFSPVFPLLGIAFAVYLMADLPGSTWIRFLVWMGVAVVIYAIYGYRNSRLRMAHGEYGVLPSEAADITHQHPHQE